MKKAYTPNINSSKGKDLTKYVSKFIHQTKFKDIPSNVVELAKKHILDGFGLALSGSVARTGDYLFKQIKKKFSCRKSYCYWFKNESSQSVCCLSKWCWYSLR